MLLSFVRWNFSFHLPTRKDENLTNLIIANMGISKTSGILGHPYLMFKHLGHVH